jgi:hypothetical protein
MVGEPSHVKPISLNHLSKIGLRKRYFDQRKTWFNTLLTQIFLAYSEYAITLILDDRNQYRTTVPLTGNVVQYERKKTHE